MTFAILLLCLIVAGVGTDICKVLKRIADVLESECEQEIQP